MLSAKTSASRLKLFSTTSSRVLQQTRNYRNTTHREKRPSYPPSPILFVDNIPFGTDSAQVSHVFQSFGPVEAVRLAYYPTGRLKGWGHVVFKRDADAAQCFDLAKRDSIKLLARDLKVSYAPPRKPLKLGEPSQVAYIYEYSGSQEHLATSLGVEKDKVSFRKDKQSTEPLDRFTVDFGSTAKATEVIKKLNGTLGRDGRPWVMNYAPTKTT